MRQSNRPAGMRAFIIIAIGQTISLLGTAMTNFGLTIWAYEKTGLATSLALIGFFFVTPLVIVSPMAGAIVDRSNRRLMMMISDLAAGLVTIVQLLLLATGNLEIWHLYITAAIAGTFQAFQWPAFSAAISMILPKEQYGRANGLLALVGTGPGAGMSLLIFLCGLAMAGVGLEDTRSAWCATPRRSCRTTRWPSGDWPRPRLPSQSSARSGRPQLSRGNAYRGNTCRRN